MRNSYQQYGRKVIFVTGFDSRLGQLEDTFGYKKWGEKGGTLLSHKLFIEDMFIRKFLKVKRFFSSRTFFFQNKKYRSADSTGVKVSFSNIQN
jgi:hypothetical protein